MSRYSSTDLLKICLALGFIGCATPANAKSLFCDTFKTGASGAWGNERGAWRTGGSQYDAKAPNNIPPTYTDVTTLPSLTDFTVKVTVNMLNDGGVWLRSRFAGGKVSGILLVTGGEIGTFNGFYWHVVTNDSYSPQLQKAAVPGVQGSNFPLKIVVKGNTFTLYKQGSTTPITTLVDSTYATGGVGLYDFSPTNRASAPRGQRFSKFCVSSP
jgi:hypothetical protein